jgi:hypothetical protein
VTRDQQVSYNMPVIHVTQHTFHASTCGCRHLFVAMTKYRSDVVHIVGSFAQLDRKSCSKKFSSGTEQEII